MAPCLSFPMLSHAPQWDGAVFGDMGYPRVGAAAVGTPSSASHCCGATTQLSAPVIPFPAALPHRHDQAVTGAARRFADGMVFHREMQISVGTSQSLFTKIVFFAVGLMDPKWECRGIDCEKQGDIAANPGLRRCTLKVTSLRTASQKPINHCINLKHSFYLNFGGGLSLFVSFPCI